MAITIKLRRDTAYRWNLANPVLAPGEPGLETDTNKIKLGNGTARWSDLEYFEAAQNAALYAEIMTQVQAVISSSIYDDDGPSLFLLYQNAKV